MSKKLRTLVLFFAALTAAVFPAQANQEPKIVAAVAANAQYPVEELAAAFKSKTGITVEMAVNSSGSIFAQIKAGAPYDIFISADVDYPQRTFESGAGLKSPSVYARGGLVIWSRTGLDLSGNLKSLLSKSVGKIALANPDFAPYGQAAIEAMKRGGVYEKVKDKLVYGESVAQVNEFVFTKSVSAGFTAKSVVLSKQMAGKGKWVEVDQAFYAPLLQAMVVLKRGAGNGEKFHDFILSEEGRAILSKYGYGLP